MGKDIEFDDEVVPVTTKVESFVREVVANELSLRQTHKFQDLKDFASGARWAVNKIMEMQGHGDWFDSVMSEEIGNIKPPSAGIRRRVRRAIIPGSRITAPFNQ